MSDSYATHLCKVFPKLLLVCIKRKRAYEDSAFGVEHRGGAVVDTQVSLPHYSVVDGFHSALHRCNFLEYNVCIERSFLITKLLLIRTNFSNKVLISILVHRSALNRDRSTPYRLDFSKFFEKLCDGLLTFRRTNVANKASSLVLFIQGSSISFTCVGDRIFIPVLVLGLLFLDRRRILCMNLVFFHEFHWLEQPCKVVLTCL